MTYRKEGNRVTLEMTSDDYTQLLIMLGFATGAIERITDRAGFYHHVDFVNRLNATNPEFLPYEIPAEFKPQ